MITKELVVRGNRVIWQEREISDMLKLWASPDGCRYRQRTHSQREPETKNYEVLGVVHGKDGLEFYKLGFTGDIEATKEYYSDVGGWATEPSDAEPYLKFVEVRTCQK